MCDRTWVGRSLAAFQGQPVGNVPSWDQVETDFCFSGSSLKFCTVRFGAVGGSVLPGALVTLRLWEQAGRILPTGKTGENPDLKRAVVVTGSAGTLGPGPLSPDPMPYFRSCWAPCFFSGSLEFLLSHLVNGPSEDKWTEFDGRGEPTGRDGFSRGRTAEP